MFIKFDYRFVKPSKMVDGRWFRTPSLPLVLMPTRATSGSRLMTSLWSSVNQKWSTVWELEEPWSGLSIWMTSVIHADANLIHCSRPSTASCVIIPPASENVISQKVCWSHLLFIEILVFLISIELTTYTNIFFCIPYHTCAYITLHITLHLINFFRIQQGQLPGTEMMLPWRKPLVLRMRSKLTKGTVPVITTAFSDNGTWTPVPTDWHGTRFVVFQSSLFKKKPTYQLNFSMKKITKKSKIYHLL